MPLAILLDTIGKPAQAPVFLLLDFTAFAFDDGLQVRRQRVHLLRADVLARDQEMLVKSHMSVPFSGCGARAGGEPSRVMDRWGRRTIRHGLKICSKAPRDRSRHEGRAYSESAGPEQGRPGMALAPHDISASIAPLAE